MAGHTAIVLKNKVFDKPDALALHYGQALSAPRLQALAEFTAQVIATRGAVPNTALRAFLDAGYTERQALDVVLGVSLATLCNFANNLPQTDINPQLQGFAVGALGEAPSAPATPPANASASWLAPLADALDERPAEIDLLGKFADDRLTRAGVCRRLAHFAKHLGRRAGAGQHRSKHAAMHRAAVRCFFESAAERGARAIADIVHGSPGCERMSVNKPAMRGWCANPHTPRACGPPCRVACRMA